MASKPHLNINTRSPRVAVYARFSCDNQRDETIEDQLADAERYCAERGYEIVAVYPDYALTGRSDDRPQFLRMIEDAKSGMFDTVLVWKIDRFARNMRDQYYYEKIISSTGVHLESVKERITGNGVDAVVTKGTLAIIAEVKSLQTAEDTMRGMLGKANKCQYLGVSRYGYSHHGDEITLDPIEAPIAREIHTRYLNGEPQSDIIEWLRSLDVRGPGGIPVGKTFVSGVLKNEAYAGVYIWGKQKDERGNVILGPDGKPIPIVRVEGGMPAIVTMEEKAACLRRLLFHKHANAKADYLLSGKLYCLECGRPMHGETCKNHDGIEFWRYCCQGRRKACTGVYWKERTEEAIAKTIRRILTKPGVAELIADGFERYRTRKRPQASIDAVKADLKTISKQRNNLIEAVEDGLPYKHVKEKMEKLDAQQAVNERKLAELERSQCEITRADVLQFLELLAQGTRTDEEILKAFVSQVWVSDDRAVAVMNFTGADTSPYEIECLLQKNLEPAGELQVRENRLWLPSNDRKTNQKAPMVFMVSGTPVALFERGLGIVASLYAA